MTDTDALRAWLILLRTPGLGWATLRERLAAGKGDVLAVLDGLQRSPEHLGEDAVDA